MEGDPATSAPGAERHDDGVEVRAIVPADRERLRGFHDGLSDDTTRLRFFAVHRELSEGELDRFTTVDHVDREAVVATVAGQIVGVGRFDRIGTGTDAEVAFVVADAWQGRGVGSALAGRLEELARGVGLRRFVAETLPGNTRMLALLHRGGRRVQVTWERGLARGVIDLDIASDPDADTGAGAPGTGGAPRP